MEPDDALLLSGIQHFAFCKRQWALIHLEGQWKENVRTVKGAIVHERAHDDTLTEKRGDLLITRGLRVASSRLGAVGQLDVVEFHQSERWAKKFPSAWQEKKRETITHPFLDEKISWGLVPYAQSLLLARTIRGDISEYPAFLWK